MLAMRGLALLATALGAAAQPTKCVCDISFYGACSFTRFHGVCAMSSLCLYSTSPPLAQELRDEWHAVRAAELDAQLEPDHVHDLPA
jgi:hypothetical protein